MILDKNTQEKPKIDYPTKWGFKIIGKDKEKIKQAIKEIIGKKAYTCKFSNSSKGGKFSSYNTECIVESEEERDNLYKAFTQHNDINYVI